MIYCAADTWCKVDYDPQVNILKFYALLCAYYGE